MRKFSVFLYLKQGIRGILKFRIQFFVIIILSFLSTFILSISLSSSKRLSQNYNNVMQKMEPFDYITTREAGIRNNNDSNYVPLNDFINFQFLSSYDSTIDKFSPENQSIQYNFNLIEWPSKVEKDMDETLQKGYEGYQSTFISKAFENSEVQQAFFDFLNNSKENNNEKGYLDMLFEYTYDPTTGSITYKNPEYLTKIGLNLGDTYACLVDNCKNTTYNNFLITFITKMKDNLIADLKNVEESSSQYLKNSLVYKLWQNGTITEQDLNVEPKNKESLSIYSYYMYFSFISLVAQIIDSTTNYIYYYLDQAVYSNEWNDNDPTEAKVQEYFNNNISKEAGFEWFDGSENNSQTIANTLYAFITGANFKGKTSKEEMIIDNEKKQLPWIQKVDLNYSNYEQNMFNQSLESIYKNGLRGSLVQIIGQVTAEGKISGGLGSTSQVYKLKIQNGFESTNETLAGYRSFNSFDDRFDINYDSVMNIKMYYFRHQLIGQALDINVENRAEIILSDSVAEMKYRLVILDNYTWPSRVTLLGGRMPTAANEILINPQYAHKNKIKLGQSVQLGGGTFVISGYATDPLAYYPVASSTDVFPNTKKTAIVYGNSATLQSIISSDFHKFASKMLFTIVTMPNNKQEAAQKMAYYYSTLAFSEKYLMSSYETINAINNNETVTYQNWPSGEEYSSFNDSIYSQNWKLAPAMTKYFKITSYCLSILISLIALSAIVIAIKKTIDLNSGEIGILKAMGVSASKISISYISYSFITMLVVVPLAWLIASFGQELLVNLFLNYSGGLYKQVIFNWWSLLISAVLFGLFSMIVSYFVAYFLTSKNVLEVLSKVEKHKDHKIINGFKQKLTKNMKFSSKLSTELAFSGFSKTLLTGTTILLASFLASGFLAVPGVVSQTLSSYYKNIKYNNEVENIDLVGNAPLAKTSLSPWQGVEQYEDTYIPSNNIFGTGIKDISKNVSSSTSIGDNSVLPKILMNQTGNNIDYQWLYDIFLNEKTNLNAENNTISVLASIFGTNFIQLVGKEFSLIEAQQLLEYIIHSNKFGDDNNKRIQEVNNVSDLLTNGLPEILSMVMPGAGSNQGGNWKEQISDIILGQAPAYVKNYLSISENRMNQYKFGYSFNTYIPNVDTMYTSLIGKTRDSSNMQLIGLLESQNAFVLPEKQQQLFIDDQNLELLKDIIYGRIASSEIKDVIINDFKMYDSQTKTLTIPTITNGEFDRVHSFQNNIIEDLNFTATRMQLSEANVDIPNSAWKYDDRDWQKISNNSSENQGWLNPEDLQSSKFTYQAIFKNDNSDKADKGYVDGLDRYKNFDSIRDDSFAFFDFEQDKITGELTPVIRPYYQYDNVVLFVPTRYTTNIKEIAGFGNKNQIAWMGSGKAHDLGIPEDTVKDWQKKLGDDSLEDFTWIRPYSYYFDASGKYSKPDINLSGAEMDEMINAKFNFLGYSFHSSSNPFMLNEETLNWKTMSEGNIAKINLQKIDKIDVYGSERAIIDQNIANLVKGYSTAKYIPFNFTYENLETENTVNIKDTKINTYSYYKPQDLIAEDKKDEWIYGLNPEQRSHIPSVWYNGVFSNAQEPYFVTTQASFARSPKIGEDTMASENANFYALIEIKNMKFMSEQQNLINELTKLILTIGIFFICFIIFVSSLSIVLISDIYVQQYKKFMITMKSLGYSNWKIIKYSFGFVSVFSLIAFILGTILSQFAILAIASYINTNFMSIPFGITWWLPLISSILIVSSYVCSIVITTSKIRKESPSTLVA
ncbi:ABC transporter permease [Spiroplasma culicicola]|uniref:ABC transporter permease n=1 Tax=Spiroplasma culicicola AES-1 TaxID=1276246 RepID=W6A6X3_9MOLU|nr:ABC transporter permease [Spiroplasma culicicola]AHI52732.1 ABC transporter permease [Spiroplasma culicicola AES-1]